MVFETPLVRLTIQAGFHGDIKGMRFGHWLLAQQVVTLRGKGNTVSLSAQTVQPDGQIYLIRVQGFSVPVSVDSIFRWNAIFKYRQLQTEFIFLQQASPVRPLTLLAFSMIATTRACRPGTGGDSR
ncbi:MAG TPA: hypothetical protein DIU19_05570 [Alcanivorax sp.]|nr:hypothetical protein [Alcanivorax sp.]